MKPSDFTKDTLLFWLRGLEEAENRIEKLWLEKYKVPNTASDKLAKLIEELGEAMQASRENDPDHELEEIVDSIVAIVGIAYVKGFTAPQIYRAFYQVERKMRDRWLSDNPPLERLR